MTYHTTTALAPRGLQQMADRFRRAPHAALASIRSGAAWLTAHPDWIWIGAPFLILAVFCYAIAWNSWFNFDQTLCFQPLVPFLVAYAIWRDREQVVLTYEELTFDMPENSKRRRGNLSVAVIGCLMIFTGVMLTETTISIAGLVVLMIGIIYCFYGLPGIRSVARPLFYLLFMIPPPMILTALATQWLQKESAVVAGKVLSVVVQDVRVDGVRITMPNFVLDVSPACSGISILFPVFVLTSFLALFKRLHLSWTGIALVSGILITLIMNVIRIVVMGLIGAVNPAAATALHDCNSLVFAVLSFYLTYLVLGLLMSPPKRRLTEFERDLALAAQAADRNQ